MPCPYGTKLGIAYLVAEAVSGVQAVTAEVGLAVS
jgi:hypothetical protein